jgi:hypothetical protein
MPASARRYGTYLVLFALAAAYLSLGRNLSLEWTDEGMIVYPSWLVAGGATPYREFRHLYGPSLFFFNGALFHLFGSDLSVIRLAIVAVKAGVATAVYAAARAIAPWPLALMTYVLCVVVWGTPWWVFNTPYANHYSLLLNLVGLLAYLALRSRLGIACLVAGVAFGLAATFKHTSGIFAFLALTLYLLWETPPAASPGPTPRSAFDRVVGWIRFAALGAALAIPLAYLGRHNTPANMTVLCAPLFVNIALLGWREARVDLDPLGRQRAVAGMFWAAAGVALPVLAYAIIYVRLRLLGRLVDDLFTELPSRVTWFVPLSAPDLRPTLLGIAATSAVCGVWQWRRATGNRRRALATAVMWFVAAAALVAFARDVSTTTTWRAYYLFMAWNHDVVPIVGAIPFVTVIWGTFVIWRDARGPGPVAAHPGAPDTGAVGVFYFFAVVSLLFLYPSADFWHLIMGLPAFLPLLAFLIARQQQAEGDGQVVRGEWLSAVTIAAIAVVLAAPFVGALRFAMRTTADAERLPRASGIVGAAPKMHDVAELLAYLDEQPADLPLFATGSEEMIYFISGRRSALDFDEFVLYLLTANAMDAEGARALVPAQRLVDRISSAKPIIIEVDGPLSARFQSAFPEVMAFIDSHYRVVHTAGQYRVLRWTDA